MKPFLTALILALGSCSNSPSPGAQTYLANPQPADSITRIEMSLSAFGVESDDFPSIDVVIDFAADSSRCYKSFYNPAYKSTTYSLSPEEMRAVKALLKTADLEKLKKEYKVTMSDQPNSKTVIHTTQTRFTIEDYGLRGDHPLQELYQIVYKF